MDTDTYFYCGTVIGTVTLLYLLSSLSRRRNIDRTTALNDLSSVGRSRGASELIKGTAVICGGSIAGLWAARICADHFQDVLIIEPESWLPTEEGRTAPFNEIGEKNFKGHGNRTRAMQYYAVHGFQPFFFKVIRHLYPEAGAEFQKGGAVCRAAMFNTHVDGIRTDILPQHDYPNGDVPDVYFATRDTFERTLRGLLYKPGGRIRWITGTVSGLRASSMSQSRIGSVTLRIGEEEKLVPAALVVDCTGGTQAGLKYIKRLLPNDNLKNSIDEYRDSYDPKLRYTTLRVTIPVDLRSKLPIPKELDDAGGFLYAFVPQPPRDHRSIIATKIEGHQLQFCCTSWGAEDMPQSFVEIIEYVKSLRGAAPVPSWVVEVLELLKGTVDDFSFDNVKNPACSWIHYEKMSSLPCNYVATGDAVMRVNPVFGQGCSKALIGALTLDKVLRSVPESEKPVIPHDFSKRFFKAQAERIAPLWRGTKPLDYGYDTTVPQKGESLKDGYFVRKYTELATQLCAQGDKRAISVLWHVRNFLAPPSDMTHPVLVLKVAFLALRRALGLA